MSALYRHFFRMHMHHVRYGKGRPLLLVHGLGGSWRSWTPILEPLAAQRELIVVDLPGFGATPPVAGPVSIRALGDALTRFLDSQGLIDIDAVGSSMGARLVLELARRGDVLGTVVSLDPGGFWRGWQRPYFHHSIWLTIRLVRLLAPLMPVLTRGSLTRALLFAQFSAHPGRLPAALALDEVRSFVAARSFDELLHDLAYGETQQGAPRGSIRPPLVICWGRRDRVCLPSQAQRAAELFPDARLHWFDDCGHFPMWDRPSETVELILRTTHDGAHVRRARPSTAPPLMAAEVSSPASTPSASA